MLWHRHAIFKSKGEKLCSTAECRIWTRSPRHQIANRLNARWQTDWAIEDQAKKTWTRQPIPMISEHSAHLTTLSVDYRTWLWRYTYLLLLIPMLWHRQAVFKSKGDKLCSSAECRIWPRGPRHQIAYRLNARWQTDWAIEDQAKNLNSTAHPYDQRAFSPLDPTVSWLSHLALAIYIYVVVNFDALAQANDFQIEGRQVVCLCWMQDSNPEGFWNPIVSRLNACWQTDWAIEDQAKNFNSTARPYDQQAFSPSDPTAICPPWLLVNSLWPSDAIRRQGTKSRLAQVMACCLTAPSHDLNHCWLIINKFPWHSLETIIMRRSEDTNQ